MNQFAIDLAARFSTTVGCTRSWDTADPTDFQVRNMFDALIRRRLTEMKVIIDNMMNLEVMIPHLN